MSWRSGLILVLTMLLAACTDPDEATTNKRMVYLPHPDSHSEFTCVKEADHLPSLDPELEARYQEVRSLEKQNSVDGENINNQYQYLAEQGHWKAASRLAYRYIKGIGGPRSYSRAFKWYQHLADRNIPQGYYNLAVMAEKGLGVDQDKEAAWAYLHRAAQLGNPHAQHRLGEIYLYPRNDDRMGELYHRCALSQGYAESARALGHLGLVQDNYPKAMYFTQVAAGMGIRQSALKLEGVFRDGDYGYVINESLADLYDNLYEQLRQNESATFPGLVEIHPLPPHPTMGLYNPETDQNEMPK